MTSFSAIPGKQKPGTLEITGIENEEEETLIIPSHWNGVPVSAVARSAFRNRRKLRTVVLSEGIEWIDVGAFFGCTQLESVSFPHTLSFIAADAFRHCTQLNDLTLPDGLNRIGSGAFADCRRLSNIVFSCIPESVGHDCFLHTALTEITADGIVHIAEKILLSYQGNASALTLPDGIVTIAAGAFSENDCLTQVICPPSLRFIGEKAFFHCRSLTSIKGTEHVIRMDAYAFSGCCRLQQILIPPALTDIPNGAFRGCSQAEQIYFPQNLTRIGSFAFADCLKITRILLPEQVTFLGQSAFFGCCGLKSVKLPSSLQTIGDTVFGACTSLLRLETAQWTCRYGNFGFSQPFDLVLKSSHIPRTVTLFFSDNSARFQPGGCARLKLSLFDAPEHIDFHEYDNCMPLLLSRTDQSHFVINRLLCPESLSSQKQEEYEQFIRTYAKESLTVILSRDMEDAAFFLCKKALFTEENLTFAVKLAVEQQKQAFLPIFMNYRQTTSSADPLDDLFTL